MLLGKVILMLSLLTPSQAPSRPGELEIHFARPFNLEKARAFVVAGDRVETKEIVVLAIGSVPADHFAPRARALPVVMFNDASAAVLASPFTSGAGRLIIAVPRSSVRDNSVLWFTDAPATTAHLPENANAKVGSYALGRPQKSLQTSSALTLGDLHEFVWGADGDIQAKVAPK